MISLSRDIEKQYRTTYEDNVSGGRKMPAVDERKSVKLSRNDAHRCEAQRVICDAAWASTPAG